MSGMIGLLFGRRMRMKESRGVLTNIKELWELVDGAVFVIHIKNIL